MPPFRMQIASAFLAIACGSCATVSNPDPQIQIRELPQSVPSSSKVPCEDPVALPDRDLTEQETTRYWKKDRTSLEECEIRRKAAVGE